MQTTENTIEDTAPDGALAAAIGVREQVWPHTFDALVWEQNFVEHFKSNPTAALEDGVMLGWFANAIMVVTTRRSCVPLDTANKRRQKTTRW